AALAVRAARARRRARRIVRRVGHGGLRPLRLRLHAIDDAGALDADGAPAAARPRRGRRRRSEPARRGDAEAAPPPRGARARRPRGRGAGLHRRGEADRSRRLADARAHGAQHAARTDGRLRGRRHGRRTPDPAGRGAAAMKQAAAVVLALVALQSSSAPRLAIVSPEATAYLSGPTLLRATLDPPDAA